MSLAQRAEFAVLLLVACASRRLTDTYTVQALACFGKVASTPPIGAEEFRQHTLHTVATRRWPRKPEAAHTRARISYHPSSKFAHLSTLLLCISSTYLTWISTLTHCLNTDRSFSHSLPSLLEAFWSLVGCHRATSSFCSLPSLHWRKSTTPFEASGNPSHLFLSTTSNLHLPYS